MANYNFDQKFNQLARRLQITTQPVVPDVPVTTHLPQALAGYQGSRVRRVRRVGLQFITPGVFPLWHQIQQDICPGIFCSFL